MQSLRVTVIPVALRPVDDARRLPPMLVSALRPNGEWLSDSTVELASTVAVARSLLERAVPSEDWGSRLESIGVSFDSGYPNLLFTAVLPIAAVEMSDSPEDWQQLVPWEGDHRELDAIDWIRAAAISHWREQLVRTTAVFDFLPKYFPISQVRSVYASLWGVGPAEANFQRWLDSARDLDGHKICEEVADATVRNEAQVDFARRLASEGLSATKVASLWDQKFIGISASVAALAGIAVVPAAVAAGAIVGAAIGWQRVKNPGRPPAWHRRSKGSRLLLRAGYPVRPNVDVWRAPFVE